MRTVYIEAVARQIERFRGEERAGILLQKKVNKILHTFLLPPLSLLFPFLLSFSSFFFFSFPIEICTQLKIPSGNIVKYKFKASATGPAGLAPLPQMTHPECQQLASFVNNHGLIAANLE